MRALTIGAVLTALQGCSVWHMIWPASKAAATPAPAVTSHVPEVSAAPPGNGAAAQAQSTGDAGDASGSAAVDAPKEPRDTSPVRRASAGSGRNALGAGEVGYYMDVLQGRLRQDVGRDASIERHGERIIVLVPAGFDLDSAEINAEGRDLLHLLAAILTEYRSVVVVVQVRGPDSDAHGRLANDRVTALSRYLTDAGVAGKRIEAGSEPTTVQGAALAGPPAVVRIELQITPIGPP